MERSVLNGMTPSNPSLTAQGSMWGRRGKDFKSLRRWVTPRKQFLPDITDAHTNSKKIRAACIRLTQVPSTDSRK